MTKGTLLGDPEDENSAVGIISLSCIKAKLWCFKDLDSINYTMPALIHLDNITKLRGGRLFEMLQLKMKIQYIQCVKYMKMDVN